MHISCVPLLVTPECFFLSAPSYKLATSEGMKQPFSAHSSGGNGHVLGFSQVFCLLAVPPMLVAFLAFFLSLHARGLKQERKGTAGLVEEMGIDVFML